MESTTSRGILEDLIETLEDGAKGFDKAAELLHDGARAQSLATELSAFSEQRRRFSAELREIAAKQGKPIEEAGSTGGAIHRAWMEVTDTASGADVGAILAAAETGEDHAVTEYDDALERDDLSEDDREVIARQAQAIGKAHDEVKALRDRFVD